MSAQLEKLVTVIFTEAWIVIFRAFISNLYMLLGVGIHCSSAAADSLPERKALTQMVSHGVSQEHVVSLSLPTHALSVLENTQ